MTKSSKKLFESKIQDAEAKVVRAAVRYVNFSDEGTVNDLHQLTKLQIKLADAVTRLENVQKNYKAAKKKTPVAKLSLFQQRLIEGYR